jgi:hypothetical protein
MNIVWWWRNQLSQLSEERIDTKLLFLGADVFNSVITTREPNGSRKSERTEQKKSSSIFSIFDSSAYECDMCVCE